MAMAIYNFHRILILAATFFFAVLCGWGIKRFTHDAEEQSLTVAAGLQSLNSNLVIGLIAAAAAMLGVAYFIYFNVKLYRMQRRGETP